MQPFLKLSIGFSICFLFKKKKHWLHKHLMNFQRKHIIHKNFRYEYAYFSDINLKSEPFKDCILIGWKRLLNVLCIQKFNSSTVYHILRPILETLEHTTTIIIKCGFDLGRPGYKFYLHILPAVGYIQRELILVS